MGEFSLPTNIRQIGSIGDGLRIYMEDYVFTYLHQYAEAGGYDERAAFLVGRHMVIDGQQVLFINGAVQGKEMETRDGLLSFTEQTTAYAETMLKEFFSGMEVVGWMQSQPSYGVYLNQQYGIYHRHVFPRDYQVMFVMDPLEKTNSFYSYNPEREAMQETRGYFIYYDKNKNMHEYMLKDRATDKPAPPSAYVEVFGERSAQSGTEEEEYADDSASDYRDDPALRAEELIRKRADDRSKRRSAAAQRRAMNLMTGLSAALFVVCFVMGAGLIQNRDEISNIKTQLSNLSTAYRNLFVQLSSDGTSPVFAAEQEDTPQEAVTVPGLPNPAARDGADVMEPAAVPPADNTAGLAGTVPQPAGSGDAAGTGDAAAGGETAGSAVTSGETAGIDAAGGSGTDAAVTGVESAGIAATGTGVADGNAADTGVTDDSSSPAPAEAAAVNVPAAGEQPANAAESGLPAEVVVNEPAAPSVPEAYTIQTGDSLLGISLEFYGNGNMVNDILALNGLADADMIVAGKTIALPRPR